MEKKKKGEHKNNLRKAIGRNEKVVFSPSIGKIKLLARFSHSNFSIRWNRSFRTLSPYILRPLRDCQFNFGRGEKKPLYPVQNCLQLNK